MNLVKNCWEIKNCGKEPGGKNTDRLGVCPAASASSFNGINQGINGGRFCWAVAGTLCGGRVQGIFAMKIETCLKCEVFQEVAEQEGRDFVLHPEDASVNLP